MVHCISDMAIQRGGFLCPLKAKELGLDWPGKIIRDQTGVFDNRIYGTYLTIIWKFAGLYSVG